MGEPPVVPRSVKLVRAGAVGLLVSLGALFVIGVTQDARPWWTAFGVLSLVACVVGQLVSLTGPLEPGSTGEPGGECADMGAAADAD